MEKAIYFDMDGTIADLYSQKGWLEELRLENPAPYEAAAPLLRLQVLARLLNQLQKSGYKIGVVSWLAKTGSASYDEKVTKAKRKWLKKRLL